MVLIIYRKRPFFTSRLLNRIFIKLNRSGIHELRELLSVTLDTIIVVEFEGGQTRLNYGQRSAEDVIAMLKATQAIAVIEAHDLRMEDAILIGKSAVVDKSAQELQPDDYA